jgi:hypothetical protein
MREILVELWTINCFGHATTLRWGDRKERERRKEGRKEK